MKIGGIKLAGWRSFGSAGVELVGLKRINIIIGQNNSGKSNFGKYFLRLKEMVAAISEPANFKDRHNIYNRIGYSTNISDTWAWKGQDITCKIFIDPKSMEWPQGQLPHFLPNKNEVCLNVDHNVVGDFCYFSISINNKNLLNVKSGRPDQIFDNTAGAYVDFRQSVNGAYDNYLYWKRFLDSLIFIDPIRHFDRASHVDMSCYFDGAAIIKELADLQSNDRPGWTRFCQSMRKWLGEIMCDRVQQVSIVDSEFRIDVLRDGETISSTLSELGTGVAQVVMLLAHLYLNKDKEFNVFLDEPESNLHPNSVVRLVKIFEDDLQKHTFFITTHSSVLIDQIGENWSVHRVSRELDHSSEVFSCALPIHKFQVLDDLGIRASQILQSNLIVWVEGPSDAIYLRKWISDLSNNEVLSGEHYSFLFYGGSNLSSHTLLDEDEVDAVDLMCASRYAAIFCDTDYSSAAVANPAHLKRRVTTLIERLKEVAASNVGKNGNLNDFVKIWLTDGRETENYVPENLFFDVLSRSPFCKTQVIEKCTGGKEVVELYIDSSLKGKLGFGKYESFDTCFAKMHKRSDHQSMTASQYAKIAEKYASHKVGISRAIVEAWDASCYTPALESQVKDLIKMIKRANGMAAS